MTVTPETKVGDLLETYPYLVDFLTGYAPGFDKLRNPLLRRTVGRFATLRSAAEMGNVDLERLVADVDAEIGRHGGESVGAVPIEMAAIHASTTPREAGRGSDEERGRRQDALKDIIRRLHEGGDVEGAKAAFGELVQQVDSSEIAEMEQALISEGLPVEEVQRLCDVHVQVFRESLETTENPLDVPEGHPIDSYRRENEVVAGIVSEVRCLLDKIAAGEGDGGAQLDELGAVMQRLSRLDVHYLRKENQLFPALERHGVSGPTKVMWGLDDEIRARLKAAARDVDSKRFPDNLAETLGMIEDMVYKEEKILLPVAMESLSPEEWADMAAGEHEIGFAWIEPPAAASPATASAGASLGLLPLSTGALSPEQVDLLLLTLPLDVTFVDEMGVVQYYSGRSDRAFPRSPAVIGRDVMNCHPPKSLDVVVRVIAELRAGTKDVADFWIEMHGRKIYIRYFPVRDAEGRFRGVLRVTQDITDIQKLEGERRLLDW